MIVVALAALLQYGSCQASGDRWRTAAEAADGFLRGVEERDVTAFRWFVKPGTSFKIDGERHSDEAFYASMSADTSARRNLVIVGLTSTPTIVTIRTVYGSDTAETLTTLRFAEGCIWDVTVEH